MIHPTTACLRHPKRTRRATTVVEMACVLPVVLVLLFGTLDFAQVMYAYGTVADAARGGARYAMVHGSSSSAPVGPTANDATVKSQTLSYTPGLDASHLTITSSWGSGTNTPGSPVTVTATYNCQLAAGPLFGLGSIEVTGTTTMLITH